MAEKANVRKRGALSRITAMVLVAAMLSGIPGTMSPDNMRNQDAGQNKAVVLASRYLSAAREEISRENYPEAITQTRNAIEVFEGTDREKAELDFQLGYLYIMENRFQDAREWLDAGLALTESSEARLVRAQVNVNLGDISAAIDDVTAYVDATGGTAETIADFINVYEAAGEFETAAEMYTRLIDTYGAADSYLHRAYCYAGIAQAGKEPAFMEKAAEDRNAYEQAGGTETATADVMLGIGWMRIEAYEAAAERFIAALEEGYADPRSLYYYIVLCSYISRNFEQACTYGDQLAERAEKGEDGAIAEIGTESTTGQMKVTLAEMDLANLLLMTGASHMQTGRFDRADELLTACLKQNESMAYASYLRGVCRLQTERYPEAEADFGRAVAADTEPESSHYGRALCRIKLDNPQGAMEDLDWVLLNGTDEDLFEAASGMMNQLIAGETPVIDR